MAHPKQKLSKARTGSRRSANRKTAMPTFETCSQCKEQKRPHFACPKCGFYKKTKRGEVVALTIKTDKKEESK